MIENRPWQSADPSRLKRGMDHSLGLMSSMNRACALSSAKAQSISKTLILTHLIWLLTKSHQY